MRESAPLSVNSQSSPYIYRLLACAAVIFFIVGPASAQAQTLISDTFTAANNTALIGRAPAPTNVPGNVYAGNGNVSTVGGITGGTPYQADIQGNLARVGADAGLALDLDISSGTEFRLSISFNISGNTQTQANDIHRGAALGFFSSVALGSSGSSHGFNNFTGLVVDRAGSVRLIISGADSGVATTVPGFNPNVDHTLSYVVNTAVGSGLMYSIQLDSTSVSLSAPVNTFTAARTVMGGFYNSSGNAADVASFDNFNISIVPEPSFCALLGSAALLIGFLRWRRNRSAGN
jgi:hypothetical protein